MSEVIDDDRGPGLTRRRLVARAGAAGALAAVAPGAALSGVASAREPNPPVAGAGRSLGSGGRPTSLATLAKLARKHGNGEPLMFVDLAAVDQNARVIQRFAARQGWAVRPALKAFQCPRLCAYVMRRLPQPRGLVFRLAQVDQIMAVAPAGTDLLMGYPSTFGELRAFLSRRPPRGQRRHTLTFLASSLENLEDLADLARKTPRPLPLNVALEFDSGTGRGGFAFESEVADAVKVLRRARRRLRLRATVCYDGWATATGDEGFRRTVAETSSEKYARYLAQLEEDGADLYDKRRLIRNGPGSSNYRNWAGKKVINEISPGSAYMYAGYLKSFDNQGLARAAIQAAPVLKDIGPYPTELITQIPQPPITGHAWYLLGSGWPDSGGTQPEFVYPPGVEDNERAGGRAAIVAPKGALTTRDYVLLWPNQSGDGVNYFGELHAVRNGRLLARWPTFRRPTGLQ
jgi:D-serine deaminase-like pyridoxal phosphate-dependent protein